MVDRYFKSLLEIIKADEQPRGTYRWLLEKLYDTPFVWVLERDANRALDGLALRKELMSSYDSDSCSVLEMMIALAIRCENDIMQDDDYGNRTSEWFWMMIDNLGLLPMTDQNYNESVVEYVINRFMYRQYDALGNGSIFYLNSCKTDMRKVELWYQMCWFLDEHMNYAL